MPEKRNPYQRYFIIDRSGAFAIQRSKAEVAAERKLEQQRKELERQLLE